MSLDTRVRAPLLDVPLVPWPDGSDERERCRAERRPCLLVVPIGVPAPLEWDELEDWVRAPLDPIDVATRQSTLRLRHRGLTRGVSLDNGLLERDGVSVVLSPLQAAVTEPLLAPIGSIVARRTLEEAHRAGGGVARRDALDDVVTRLRATVRPLGLRLIRLRGDRFVLDAPARSSQRTGPEMRP